jgi:transglutaminase-like putative cysteine protease
MKAVASPVAILLLVANAAIFGRALLGGVSLADMRPQVQYFVNLRVEADLRGEPARIQAFLPRSGPRQTLSSEKVESSGLAYAVHLEGENRRAVWSADGVEGHVVASYDALVDVHPERYVLPEAALPPPEYPTEVLRFLQPSETVQSDAPEVRALVDELLDPLRERDLATRLRTLFDFVSQEVTASDYENTLDALTTLKWREAFCGGKSRLLAALLRAADVPARLVGGLILESGAKRTSHVWVEAWVNGVWVPMDALNDHFAEHPPNYLVLYVGDEALFSRTENINFQYSFSIRRWRVPPDERLATHRTPLLDPYVMWESFRKAHISLNLLRIVLLLPVGVLVVVLCRNVVGMTTFGTFHPALMAVAFRDTGLLWGIALYVVVLSAGLGLRTLLERLKLLHTPRLALLLAFVVAAMIGVTYTSVQVGTLEPAHVTMFPIAILAITVESFASRFEELGPAKAFSVLLQSVVVIALIYAVIESYAVQAIVFVFPEILFAVAAAYLLLGRYVGLRLAELRRFRWLATS